MVGGQSLDGGISVFWLRTFIGYFRNTHDNRYEEVINEKDEQNECNML